MTEGRRERADALARLARLRKALGKLSVTGRADARFRVAHVEGRAPPSKVFLAPGAHEVVIEVAGLTSRKTLTIEAGKEALLEVEASAPAPSVVVPSVEAAKPSPKRAPDEPGATKPAAPGSSGLSVQAGAGVGLGVVALAAAGAAVGLGVAALDARDRFVASGQRDAGARADADTLRTVTNVAWVGAGAFLVAGVVLLATTPWSKPSTPSKPGKASGPGRSAVARSLPLAPEVSPTGGGAVLRLPF